MLENNTASTAQDSREHLDELLRELYPEPARWTHETVLSDTILTKVFDEVNEFKREQQLKTLENIASELKCKTAFREKVNTFKRIMKKDKAEKNDKKEPLTVNALFAELVEKNINVRFNAITNEAEIQDVSGVDTDAYLKDYERDDWQKVLPVQLKSDLCEKYTGCTTENIIDLIQNIERLKGQKYNPVLDRIKETKWDGVDRFPELFEIMRLDPADELSRTLIKKWMWQGLALLENTLTDRIMPQGILTLAGGQGIGKTTFFDRVGNLGEGCHYVRTGQRLDKHDKDFQRRCTTTWISELGELDTTFKSDMGFVKSFITQSVDEQRLPYARADEKTPRRTNLGASVNGTQFLIDPTGNRRFWTVVLDKKMDIKRLRKFNALELWREVWELYYMKDGKRNLSFYLTESEDAELAERNGSCEKPLKGEDEIRDLLYKLESDKDCKYEEMTVTDFKDRHCELSRYSVRQISMALDKIGYPQKRTNKGRLRELPTVLDTPYDR